jgi:hypothetical protein
MPAATMMHGIAAHLVDGSEMNKVKSTFEAKRANPLWGSYLQLPSS